jgi:hypothetical protein
VNDESAVLVPLGSNADGLLAGERVSELRGRLKQASITSERLMLEQGVLIIDAGPRGSSAFRHGAEGAEFQIPEQRSQGESTPFTVAVGKETTPGVPATDMRALINSETSISWSATLEPFRRELPASVDWVEFVTLPTDPCIIKTASEWARTDAHNAALRTAIPEQFVRSLIIKNADADLALAAHAGVAVMQDRTHQQVLACRFDDEMGWRATGFALPIVLPDTAGLDWDSVAQIRNHKAMAAFRQALLDVETRAVAEAQDGDVATAAHHAFERYLAQVAPKLHSLPDIGKEVVVELAIGTMLGVATSALTGPSAIPVGAALGVVPTAVRGLVGANRASKRRWDIVYNELLSVTGTSL